MLKRIFSVMILTLVMLSMLTLAFNIQPVKAEPTMWTVDDEPADFHTIQEAINHANEGDTIFVRNGTYYENVVVNKTVWLIGEGREATIIDGNLTATVVTITANEALISNFTIQNSGKFSGNCYGIYLYYSSSNTISGNKIINNYDGIVLEGDSNHNSITGNYITVNDASGIVLWGSSYNSISGNNIVNNTGGYCIVGEGGSNYNNISENCIASNSGDGIVFWEFSSYNIIYGNSITVKGKRGIYLASSLHNSIYRNNLLSNKYGISLHRSSNNAISGNNITTNQYGIGWLYESSNNKFYHNNFIDNAVQIQIEELGIVNVWDDGYPSGGNYWNDYTDIDSNFDGIGDTQYVVDSNNIDHYPLMGMWSNFNATSQYHVQTICNSTISAFQFNGAAISFNVKGENDTTGFCRICIPTALMSGTYRVFINGTEILPPPLPLPCSNSTHTYLYFNYTLSTKEVIIVPEFPSLLVMALFMIATLLAVMVYKKEKKY